MQKYRLIWHQFKIQRWSIKSWSVQQQLLHQWMPGDNLHAAAIQGPGIRLTTAASMGIATELCQDGILLMLIHPSLSHFFFPHDLASSLFALFQFKRNRQQCKAILTRYMEYILNGVTFNYWAVNCSSNSGPLSYVILEHGSLDSTALREW